MDANDERVLCVPRSAFDVVGAFSGIRVGGKPFNRYWWSFLADAGPAQFRPRSEVEDDPAWLQVIPYVVIRQGGSIYAYDRGKGGGDARLHSRWSVGFGGHIESTDSNIPTYAMFQGMRRELREEIGTDDPGNWKRPFGVIFDDSDPVGRVHFGFVWVADIETPLRVPDGYTRATFKCDVPESFDPHLFESWSRLVLDALVNPIEEAPADPSEPSGLSREIAALGRVVHETKMAKGWGVTTSASWASNLQIPADLALVHSEVSEALEAFRKDDRAGFAEELADVFIRVVGLTHGLGIDLGAAVLAKAEQNRGRPVEHGGKRL